VSKKIIPLAGMVLVEDEEEKLSSGIVLAEEKDKQSQVGKVVDHTSIKEEGVRQLLEAGYQLTLQDNYDFYKSNQIKIGDTIIYKKYSASEVELEGKKYRIVAFQDIIGIIK